MLRIQLIGFAVVSVVAMSAMAAGSASAETVLKLQWLLYHSQSLLHLLLAEPLEVHSLGLFLLEDSKVPAGAIEIHCHLYDEGTVGPHGLGLIKLITLELLGANHEVLCEFDPGKHGGCESGTMPTIEAVHLPWLTGLVLASGGKEVRDLILADPSGGGGRPGWKIKCKTIIGTVTDECLEEEGKPSSTRMENTESGVLGTVDQLTPRRTCSIGGEGSGTVTGTVLTENPSPTLLLLISPLD